ncbi:hypothetical protein BASA81_002444 [Batrachochytrium salamandrivorans]|nr:hypothetical protein BASA81_002444 [Batrachochytrium salamandrivorans]
MVRINVLFVALQSAVDGGGLQVECTADSVCQRLLSRGKSISPTFFEFPERTGLFEFPNPASAFRLGLFDIEDSPLGFATLPVLANGVQTVQLQGGLVGELCAFVNWWEDGEDEEEEEIPLELEIVLKSSYPSSPMSLVRDGEGGEQFWLSFQYCEMEVCSAVFTNLHRPRFPSTTDTFKIIATCRNAKVYVQNTPLVIKVNSSLRGVLAAAVVLAVPNQQAPASLYAWMSAGAINVGEFFAEYRVYKAEDEEGGEEDGESVLEDARSVSPPPPPPPPPPLASAAAFRPKTIAVAQQQQQQQSFQDSFKEFSELKAKLLAQERHGLGRLAELTAQQERMNSMETELQRTGELLEKREKQLAVREREFRSQIIRERKLVSDTQLKLDEEREELAKLNKQQESIAVRKLQLHLKNLSDDKKLLLRELNTAKASLDSLQNRLLEEMEISKTKDDRIAKLRGELKRQADSQQQRQQWQQQQPQSAPRQATTTSRSHFISPSQMTAAEKLQFLIEAKSQLQRTNPDLPELWRQFDSQIESARRAATTTRVQ